MDEMVDQQRLVETLVGLADTLVEDYDVIDFMQTLAERTVELLDVTAAGIMLADAEHRLRHAACSSEQMRLVEFFELQVEQGPCFDAYRDQVAIRSDSLEDAEARWPEFAPHARDGGFIAMAAVPLRLRGEGIGALNIFSTFARTLGDGELGIVQAMADIATIGILQERLIRDRTTVSAQLEGALESRVLIEQAKGVVAEREQTGVDEAFVMIRRFARNHNRPLRDTASGVIDGTITGADLTATSS